MKVYTVYFSKPVGYIYTRQKFNKDTGRWEEAEFTEMAKRHQFYTLSKAKAFIKANLEHFVGSNICSVRSSGEIINHGEIQLKGINKTFTANTRQTKSNY